MITLGLTGSIAMGKSTVTKQFAELGAKTNNADAIVHALFKYDQDIFETVKTHFPSAVKENVIDRKELGKIVFGDSAALKILENSLHPKVKKIEEGFVEEARKQGAWLVVLDIPLLLETGGEKRFDKVAVVSASPEVQKERVLARSGMTEEKFQQILARQMPDAEKRKRADFIIPTDQGLDASFAVVKDIVNTLKSLDEQRRK